MIREKKTIRVKSENFNANALDFITNGDVNRSKNIVKFALYGMGLGVGYGLLFRKSVLFNMFAFTLVGMGIGTIIDRKIIKK